MCAFVEIIKMYEAQYGIVTQCVCKQTCMKVGAQTLQNIAMKTNMKLGGLNYTLDKADMYVKLFMSDDVMFVSYDVSKPPPLSNSQRRAGLGDSEPSVVGMAATTEKEKMLATIDYTLQPGRHEEVVGLEQLVTTMLDRFARAHAGRLPSRLIIYRDGVSEGEYSMCLSSELPRIRAAYEAAADRMKQKPKVGHARSYALGMHGTV